MTNDTGGGASQHNCPYRTMETVLIVGAAGSLSFVTILGNILVMLSIRVNRHLQTVNNYYLFSLAFADLVIGAFSMNLYTVYMLVGYWPFGPVMCDLWLVVDYVVSNASNMNLLIISVDRYLCVTRPLTYPSRRSRRCAGLAVLAAWVLSLLLWAPAILTWQRFRGQQPHQRDECYIQLLSNPAVTLATAVPSFYLPAIIMTVLYARISLAGRRRAQRQSSAPNSHGAETFSLRVSASRGRALPRTLHPAVGASAGEDTASLDGDSGLQSSQLTGAGEASFPSAQSSCATAPEGPGRGPGRGQGGLQRSALRFPVLRGRGQKLCVCVSVPEPASPAFGCRPNSVTATQARKRSRRSSVRERKVTRTILAVLLAFMVTWTPYNVMVLIGTFCHVCVPDTLWTVGYWLCYINSTVNPACYALCNVTFKKTFRNLLLCRYKNFNSK